MYWPSVYLRRENSHEMAIYQVKWQTWEGWKLNVVKTEAEAHS